MRMKRESVRLAVVVALAMLLHALVLLASTAPLVEEYIEHASCISDKILQIDLCCYDATLLSKLSSYPIAGVGPYKLQEFRPDELVVYESFEGYYSDLPSIPVVHERFFAEPMALVAALQAGEIHMAFGDFSFSMLQSLLNDPNLVISFPEEFALTQLAFNVSRPPFDSVQLRRAIASALNRKELNELSSGGMNKPRYGIVPPAWSCYVDAFGEQDLDSSIQRLMGVGYHEGNPLRFTLACDPAHAHVATILKQCFANTGMIETEVLVLQHPELVRLCAQGEIDAVIATSYPAYQHPDAFLSPWLVESTDFLGIHLNRSTNAYDEDMYNRFVALLDEGRQELDGEERTGIYQEVQYLLAESAILVPLFSNLTRQVAVSVSGLSGIKISPIRGLQLEELYWTDEMPSSTRIGVLGQTSDYDSVRHILWQLGKSLVDYDPIQALAMPSLAESWDVSEDPIRLSFQLSDGYSFWGGGASCGMFACDATVAAYGLARMLGLTLDDMGCLGCLLVSSQY